MIGPTDLFLPSPAPHFKTYIYNLPVVLIRRGFIPISRCLDVEILSKPHSVFQNDWDGLEVDYIHKYGEQNYKYW